MTIVITGAGGFVGQHIISRLAASGQQVVGVDTTPFETPHGIRSIIGDFADKVVRDDMLADGCSTLIHLATVPGGAAEADPAASRRINIDAMYDLIEETSAIGRPRIIFASSIAVFGDPLPASGVDDTTPLLPKMIYGGHKAMMETAITMFHQRGKIDGVSLRLPGILARPKGPSGMKSAFMSNLFHALRAGEEFTCPVSKEATIWAQSVACCADNFVHAVTMDSTAMPKIRAVTLPAQCVKMVALASEIASQCGVSEKLVHFEPDHALEAAFGSHPELTTKAAENCGFVHDGDVAKLVASALATLA